MTRNLLELNIPPVHAAAFNHLVAEMRRFESLKRLVVLTKNPNNS